MTVSFDESFVRAALVDHYDIVGEIEPLPGEIDANYKITTADSQRFVLRVHRHGCDPQEADLQASVLTYLAHAEPALAVQRVVASRSGALLPTAVDSRGLEHLLRVTTWIDGDVWAKTVFETAQERTDAAAALGGLLGRLDRALLGFHHSGATRHHRWDIARALDHCGRVEMITDRLKRDAVEQVLSAFTAHVVPRADELPRQVVHNDANDYNVLVSDGGEVTGLIDFGDIVDTWRVNEVAVACAYAMIGAPDPIAAVVPLVAGYHDENPLTEGEADVLFDLILTRLASSICMAAEQIRADPANSYLLISQNDVWERLQRLRQENRRIAVMRLRAACRFEPVPTRRNVVRWLERNGHRFAPVFDRPLTADRLRVLDLSADGPNAGLTNVESISHADAAETATAIGRYGEDRSVYRSAAFETADPHERRTIHVGIDLFAPAGEAVQAPLDGIVAETGCDLVPLGFGGILLLEHQTDEGVRFWTLYGHLSSASLQSLRVGDVVRAGQTVARLGRPDENGQWPPHLHFQIMTDRCDWSTEEIIGVVARSGWDVWSAVFPDPNLVLGLPTDTNCVVSREPGALRRERHYVIGRSLSLAYRDPLKIVRGAGVNLFDDRGTAYLDMVNNVCHVGHCHPRVVAAGVRQMALLNTNSRYLHDNLVEYARRLTDTLPDELSVVYMVNSGSEANDLALRLARTYTGRREVITVDHVYHGNLTSLIEISPYKFDGPGGSGRAEHVRVAEMPDLYRGRYRAGDPDAGARYAASVAAVVDDLVAIGRPPAAFFSEAILGTGGLLPLPDGYLRSAFAHVRAAGGVCVSDEVQVGFGRVGSHMWAFELQGVVPDIVTMGKPIGNGHPMAAVVTRPEIAAAFANGMEYFSTFGGNPVSAAIGLAVLDVVRDERLMHNAASVGERLMTGVRALAERHRLIGDVRGHGLFIGIELVRDRNSLEPATDGARRVVEAMKARHILLSTDGPFDNVLKIKPPMVFSAAHCDRFLAALDDVLTGMTDH